MNLFNLDTLVAFSAAIFCGALALAVVLLKKRSTASWLFSAGMTVFAIESAVQGFQAAPSTLKQFADQCDLNLVVSSFFPGVWLCYSLTYSRGNSHEFLSKWRYVIAITTLLPISLAFGFHGYLLSISAAPEGEREVIRFTAAALALNVSLLVSTVLILMNLEQTFRSAVGTMRWRVKFVVLGLAVIFGARVYTLSDAVLFSSPNPTMRMVEVAALVVGCAFIVVAYLRRGLAEMDIYPSRAFLQNSITVVLAGGYLVIVGLLAQGMRLFRAAGNFELRALAVLLGIAALAVILLSERFQLRIKRFVSVHFRRPQYDFRKVWTQLSRCFSGVSESGELCNAVIKVISNTFNVLSVTIWLVDERRQRLVARASTFRLPSSDENTDFASLALDPTGAELHAFPGPFDLDSVKETWGDRLRQICSTQFRAGGHRICIPLLGADCWLGVVILADRVDGTVYTVEELDLLKCIGDQLTASLLNLRLTHELVTAKQLEAFRTMSAFFVHDLKNAASTLNLTLKNLPLHFDDPAFRADALRSVGNTARRIDELISRLSILRQQPELKPVDSDLNQLVTEVLESLRGMPNVELMKELRPLPKIVADREQIRNVVTNLLLNAQDALAGNGRIRVQTDHEDGRVVLSVADNGCGMSAAFLKDSLFRPFQSTKTKGLGIGMFQSRMIVEAHRGSIQAESEAGKGTTFRVIFPAKFES